MSTGRELLTKTHELLSEVINIMIGEKLDLLRRFSALESEIKASNRTEAVAALKPTLFKKDAAGSGEKPVTAMPTGQPKKENWEFPDKPKVDINHLNPSKEFDDLPPIPPKTPPPYFNDLPFDSGVTQTALKPRIAAPPNRPIPPSKVTPEDEMPF